MKKKILAALTAGILTTGLLTGNVFEEDGDRIDRKLNVALTRAREQLFLVGNPYLLNLDPLFRHLISYVKQAGIYLDVPYMDFCEDHFIY